MLKRMSSWNSYLNDCNELGGLPGQTYAIFLAAVFLLVQATPRDSFAQRQAGCDSVEHAWHSYFRADFDKALALVADCEEPEALELRVFVALKRQNQALAEKLLCKLLKSNPDYQPDPTALPAVDFLGRVEELRRECFPKDALIIQPETNILGWMQWNGGYGRIFGDDESREADLKRRYFPHLAHLRLGFGKAEVELRSIDIKNDKDVLKDQLLVLAFKLQLVSEGLWHRRMPALSAHFRTTVADVFNWNTDLVEAMRYRRSLEQLRIIADKNFKNFQLHAGADFNFSVTNCVYPDTALSSEIYCQEDMLGYRKITNSWAPYAQAQWRAGSWTMFTVAWHSVPFYLFTNGQNSQTEKDRSYFSSLDMGTRIFPVRWLAIDLLANILLDPIEISSLTDPKIDSQNDWRFKVGVTMGFSASKFIPQPQIF